MTKKAFITGVTGQDGSYLAELLLEKGYEVWGMARRSSVCTTGRVALALKQGMGLVEGDMADPHCLDAILHQLCPDEIYNLAAQSHVGTSFCQPAYTWEVNATGVLHLFAAVKRCCPDARVYQASTSEMFGSMYSIDIATKEWWLPLHLDYNRVKPGDVECADGAPYQDEDTPFSPNSPYAVAKMAAHHMARVMREQGHFVSCGILFNHESPRRCHRFVTQKIAGHVAYLGAALKAGVKNPIPLKLGNLDAHRDWGYAPEYVEAMWRLLQVDHPTDCVVATGKTATVREFLGLAFAAAGISGDPMEYVEIDPNLYRPCEVPYLCGSPEYAKRLLGWEAKVGVEELAQRMVACAHDALVSSQS